MANIELNKPLYKAEDDKEFVPPTPRQPKPSLLARGAALFLDVMLLHLVFGFTVKYLPQVSLSLGWLAPWLGLLIGYVYFALGFSHVTLGRTLGKLILRVQVCDSRGPDLSVGRAFIRAAALLWPLPVLLVLNMLSERSMAADEVTVWGMADVLGTLLLIGWLAGNFAFTALEPFNRSVHDRLAGSIVINAELEAEPVAAYLAEARPYVSRAPRTVSIVALGTGVMLCLAYGAVSLSSINKEIKNMSVETSQRMKGYLIEGYGRPMPWGSDADEASTETIRVDFHYRKRTPIDLAALKSDPRTTAALEWLIADRTGENFAEEFKEFMQAANAKRAREGMTPMEFPRRLAFEVSFVELADLYFARESQVVYSLAKTVDMPTTFTETATTSTAAAATATTATAASETTGTVGE